jgi:hypothetical protein
MPDLPPFQTLEEAAAWAETHDTAPYFDDMEEVPPVQTERPRHKFLVKARLVYTCATRTPIRARDVPADKLAELKALYRETRDVHLPADSHALWRILE